MHDIGKNIVGVVLGCNNYEVIDLGVMVPADTILDTARRGRRGRRRPLRADHAVARRDGQRRARDGAARARPAAADRRRDDVEAAHRRADRARVRAADRARARRLARRRRRLRPARPGAARARSTRRTARDQERLREQHAERDRKPLLPLARALREPAPRRLRRPARAGVHRRARRRARRSTTLRAYIDWQFFFHAWELKGKFPAILERPGGARAVRRRAGAARRDRPRRRCSQARGVYGFWPAASDGDDIVVDRADGDCASPAAPAGRLRRLAPEPLARRLRRAGRRPPRRVRGPASSAPTSSPRRFEAEHDDYRAIMVKALADRLAEAFAEYLHERGPPRLVRARASAAPNEELIAERYRGIRPAFGYPACPDHTEKRKLFELLGAEALGFALTETFAMTPAAASAASTSPTRGAVLLGRPHRPRPGRGLRRAARALALAEVERWLRPNLAYEPTRGRSSSRRAEADGDGRQLRQAPALHPRRRGGVPAPQRRELRAELALRRGLEAAGGDARVKPS